jgi:hypothetical protein
MHAAARSAAGGYQALIPGQSWKTIRERESTIQPTYSTAIVVAFQGGTYRSFQSRDGFVKLVEVAMSLANK